MCSCHFILECCVTFSGVKLSIRPYRLFYLTISHAINKHSLIEMNLWNWRIHSSGCPLWGCPVPPPTLSASLVFVFYQIVSSLSTNREVNKHHNSHCLKTNTSELPSPPPNLFWLLNQYRSISLLQTRER